MLITCPVCGAHVPRETAVEISAADGVHRYCSTGCADAAESEAGRPPAAEELPPPPRRILVAVDGSGPSLRAVKRAAAIARATRGELELVHATVPGWLRRIAKAYPAVASARLGLDSEEIRRAFEQEAQSHLARCRRLCDAAGVKCSTRVVAEEPLQALLEGAKEADLVVVGARGRDAVTGVLMGSLSQRLIARSPVPVLVVH